MALVRNLSEKSMERSSLHEEIDATYTIFERDGKSFVQINTYGRTSRDNPGKLSQTLQLDREGGEALYKILKKAFSL